MKTAVVFVHGLMTNKNQSILKKLYDDFPESRGLSLFKYKIFEFNYGFFNPIDAIRKNSKNAKQLADFVNAIEGFDKIVIIAHSNGCALTLKASSMFNKVDVVVSLHGAAPRDKFPHNTAAMHVYYTKKDGVISILHQKLLYPFKWLRKATGWGDIGIRGYEGKGNAKNFKVDTSNLNCYEAHLAVFHKQVFYGKFIRENVEKELRNGE